MIYKKYYKHQKNKFLCQKYKKKINEVKNKNYFKKIILKPKKKK